MSDDNTNPANHGPDSRQPKLYKVQIDKQVFETANPKPTGLELLILAGKSPPSQFALYKKMKGGGQPQRVALTEHVDLTDPGIERFVTLPLDQTEGLEVRRQFKLPEDDMAWLQSLSLRFELVAEGSVLRVVIYDWPVPPGYQIPRVTVNVRIDAGYPDNQIDMVYFHPALARQDGRSINALASDSFDGMTWQRWSRHRTPANPWRPGIDNLATHFALVDDWLTRELAKA